MQNLSYRTHNLSYRTNNAHLPRVERFLVLSIEVYDGLPYLLVAPRVAALGGRGKRLGEVQVSIALRTLNFDPELGWEWLARQR